MRYHLIAGDLVAQLSLGGLQSGAKLPHIHSMQLCGQGALQQLRVEKIGSSIAVVLADFLPHLH